MDVRPVQDSRVADVVNDDSKVRSPQKHQLRDLFHCTGCLSMSCSHAHLGKLMLSSAFRSLALLFEAS